MLAENTHDKYRKNDKSNKNQDLEKKKPRRVPKCPQISQKWLNSFKRPQGVFLKSEVVSEAIML